VIGQWKRQLVEGAAELFRRGKGGVGKSEEELTAPLYEEIGRLKVEVDWLKKKL
jgi:putative transposase